MKPAAAIYARVFFQPQAGLLWALKAERLTAVPPQCCGRRRGRGGGAKPSGSKPQYCRPKSQPHLLCWPALLQH